MTMTSPIRKHIVDNLEKELGEAKDALRAIAYMDFYTRDGEEPAYETMRKIALRALNSSVPYGWNDVVEENSKALEEGVSHKDVLRWAVSRWYAEVYEYALQNATRCTLDDTWRKVIRYLGGDDTVLCGLQMRGVG